MSKLRDHIKALTVLRALSAQDEQLAAALALVDVERLQFGLDGAALGVALADAEREQAYEELITERSRRAAAAGSATIAALCRCGHTGIWHAAALTDDGRIPCAEHGCPCDDLDYAREYLPGAAL